MRKLTILISTMLLLAMLLGEVSTIFTINFPDMAAMKINPWLDKGYKFYDPEGISLGWFMKHFSNDLQDIIIFFVLAKAAYQYSFKLFIIAWIFFGYHVIDAIMLWVNYKQGYFLYFPLNGAILAGIVVLLWPKKRKKTAIVKSLQ